MLQTHSGQLQAVLDIVLSHQGAALKSALLQRLMSALVLPAPEHYRALLRRLAALSGEDWRAKGEVAVHECLEIWRLEEGPCVVCGAGCFFWKWLEVFAKRGAELRPLPSLLCCPERTSAEVAQRAQQLLEQSLLGELRTLVGGSCFLR